MNFTNFIQIAGVIDSAEARMLIDCGAEYLGFPLRLDVHSPDLSEAEAREIIKTFPATVQGVLITYLESAQEIKSLCDFLGVRVVQVHGPILLSEISKLKSVAPEITVIKSLVVSDNNFSHLQETVEVLSQFADAFITDTFDPATGASGATGKTHDWEISRKLVELSPKPVILAGGLNPENVAEAISIVKPAGVDSHTGVEDSTGRKSPLRVREFVERAKSAFVTLHTGG